MTRATLSVEVRIEALGSPLIVPLKDPGQTIQD
jgi:hypothetical protein